MKDLTPYEAWYAYKPSLKFLIIFCCLYFTYIPQVKRDKLDKKAETGIFVGYSTVSKAYKIFQPQTGCVIVSRDVHFVENEQWDWESSTKVNQSPNAPNSSTLGSMTEEFEDDGQDVAVDDAFVRGTRLSSNIYQRCNVAVCEPAGFHDAKNSQHWMAAMQEELSMIEKNKTWELVDRPPNRKIIGVRWVFRTKLSPDGSIIKFKARLVVKGYAQVFGVDYSETFAPVVRLDTVRLLFALAAQRSWKVYHLDVKFAFLNGDLQEEIFVEYLKAL